MIAVIESRHLVPKGSYLPRTKCVDSITVNEKTLARCIATTAAS